MEKITSKIRWIIIGFLKYLANRLVDVPIQIEEVNNFDFFSKEFLEKMPNDMTFGEFWEQEDSCNRALGIAKIAKTTMIIDNKGNINSYNGEFED